MIAAPSIPPAAVQVDPKSRRWRRLLVAGVVLYLLVVVGVAAVLLLLADRWWVATLVLFGPRWVWALPLPSLAALAWRWDRRLLGPLGVAAFVLVLPFGGLELPTPDALVAGGDPPDLRVMTYNLGGGHVNPQEIAPLLDEIAPDVAVFQECQTPISAAKPELERRGWRVNEAQWGSCIASRHPIVKIDARDPKDMWDIGGSGVIVRYEVQKPGFAVQIVNLHLETVREGLAEVRRRAWRGAPAMRDNLRQRDFESGLARAWTERGRGPLVVAGDLNMPEESAIYKRHWSSFTNAFSEAGFGFGRTKVAMGFGIRIDHILLGPGWMCTSAWVGRHLDTDHRPLVAELRWLGDE